MTALAGGKGFPALRDHFRNAGHAPTSRSDRSVFHHNEGSPLGRQPANIRPTVTTALARTRFAFLVVIAGCLAINSPAEVSVPALSLKPADSTIQLGQTIRFSVVGAAAPNSCSWQSSSVLRPTSKQSFEGVLPGSTVVSVTCGRQTAQATVAVTGDHPAGPLVITKGGTYSGSWNSN